MKQQRDYKALITKTNYSINVDIKYNCLHKCSPPERFPCFEMDVVQNIEVEEIGIVMNIICVIVYKLK